MESLLLSLGVTAAAVSGSRTQEQPTVSVINPTTSNSVQTRFAELPNDARAQLVSSRISRSRAISRSRRLSIHALPSICSSSNDRVSSSFIPPTPPATIEVVVVAATVCIVLAAAVDGARNRLFTLCHSLAKLLTRTTPANGVPTAKQAYTARYPGSPPLWNHPPSTGPMKLVMSQGREMVDVSSPRSSRLVRSAMTTCCASWMPWDAKAERERERRKVSGERESEVSV